MYRSGPEAGRGLDGELQVLDAQQRPILVYRVVDVGQILQSRALSHSSELVVHRAVTDAHPAVVHTQVGNGDAAQVRAHGRAHQNCRLPSWGQHYFLRLVQDRLLRVLVVFLVHFGLCESSHEDRGAVPDDLENLGGGKLGDVALHVGVAIVAGPAVESADEADGVHPGQVEEACEVDCGEGVDLGPADVGLLLVVGAVLVEPVVDVGLEVDVVAEVAGTGRGGEELGLVGDGVGAVELLVGALVVLADEAEGAADGWVRGKYLASGGNCAGLCYQTSLKNMMEQPSYNPIMQPSKPKVIESLYLKNKILPKLTLQEDAELMVSRFNFEDTLGACGYSDGSVKVFNLSTDNKISDILTSHKYPVNSLRWKPINENSSSMSSLLLVANTNGHLYQYVARSGKEVWHLQEEDNYIMALDYCEDGSSFASAGKDNVIRIYDDETKKLAQQLKSVKWHKAGHNNRVFALRFKPDDSNIIVSGGWDMNVNIWDRRLKESTSTLCGPKISGDSVDIRGDQVLTGASRTNQQVQLWDWRNHLVSHTFEWHLEEGDKSAFINSAQFSHHSSDVLAAGGGQMKIFQTDSLKEAVEIRVGDDTLYTCDSGYVGAKYLLGGKGGRMHLLGSNKVV